ncbi:MAG: hypothetical protein KC729_05940 [Candidatus Eisenbacteria bacterium]|uniref:Uncharacterized protein n=1 Tax=Eiseniibacteriota bacterium TaxID=2212470 RepID=A0A956LZX7_UNCEI|nr:hypothetical protein [Candidatus Eisenbacteria bacterium]
MSCTLRMVIQDDTCQFLPWASARDGARSARGWILALTVLLGLAGGTGCSDRQTAPSAPEEPPVLDLDSALGGFSASDEEPAFGDDAIAALVEAEIEFEDPVSQSSEFTSLAADPTVRVYAVSLLWGDLDRARGLGGSGGGNSLLDWSGRARLTRGIIVVERLIGFDRLDAVDETRLDARQVSWTSHAALRQEGLRLSLWIRGGAQDSLFVEAGPYAGAWPVDALASFVVTGDAPGSSQQITIRGLSVRDESDEGFAQGFWIPPTSVPGSFAGRWMGARGDVLGFVEGIYGTSSAGDRVLFGKWIDREGRFRGFLRGSWEPASDGPGLKAASFDADLLTPASDRLERVGSCSGRWRVATGRSEGAFEARWCLGC